MKGTQRKTTVTTVTTAAERYRLELIALPSSTPAIIRLRAALKLFLRAFRLRCVSIVEAPAAPDPSREA